MIIAIDPGNKESAYVILSEDLRPIEFAKLPNEELMEVLDKQAKVYGCVVIECIASYGMSVGQTVFDTCIWIGRFTERAKAMGAEVNYIYRKDEKMNLCHTMKANDSNITQALIDRFAPDTPNKGKGSKKEQGYFYGFAKDIWQAYAVGITYYDMYIKTK